MTLTPISKRATPASLTPVFKSDDPLFNHEVAERVYSTVMKMDDDTAEMFSYFLMADILDGDIEANQRTLQRHVDEVVHKRIERIKKALLTTVAKSESEESLAYAEALAEITKAYKNPYETGRYQFDESDFRRDSRTGRFQTKVKVNPKFRPLSDKQARNLGIAPAKVPSKNQAQYQQEYMQIANFLNVVSQAGDLGDHDISLRVQQKNGTGNQHWVPLAGKPRPGVDWDPITERVVAVEARPNNINVGGASFGLVNSLSGHQMSRGTVASINRADAKFDSFADNWSDPNSDPYNSNARLYNRVRTGSEFVANVAPYGSKTHMAAKLAQAIGDHGPQAEKVLGPAARKTAYRYRGVEKTPDKQVVRDFDIAVGRGERPQLTEEQSKRLRARQTRAITNYRNAKAENLKKPVESVKVSEAEIKQVRSDISRKFMEQVANKPDPEAQRRAVISVLGAHLRDAENRKHVPSKDLYRLQLAAGNTPPSEGFLLDKDGKVVTQAVGYGDDHYLPFNLKHLKSLRGGEYIRSRSVGGPTSEDIYTGLMSGAKRVTVVSRSGTFVIDFDEDFKGKRRYNDKARRMVRRYEKLLDAVQSEQVERNQSVAPEVKSRIAREVNEEMGALSRPEIRQEVKRRVEDYKNELGSEREDFAAFASDEALKGDLDETEKRRFYQSMMNDWDKHNEFKFQLNGAGYRDALLSLQEQFPYYFSVDYIPTTDTERFETELDQGYVEPGRNRPTKANAGWYGTKGMNEGTGWISASHANYQRGNYGVPSDAPREKYAGGRAASAPAQREATETEQPQKTTTGTLARIDEVPETRVKEVEEKAQEGYQGAALHLVKTLRDNPAIGHLSFADQLPVTETDDAKILDFFKDKSKNVKTDLYITKTLGPWIVTTPEMPQEVKDAYANYQRAAGQRGRVSYDPKLALTRTGAPFLFPGAAYEPGADPSLVQAEADKIDARTQPVSSSGLRLSNMRDEDINNEIDVLNKVSLALEHTKGLKGQEKIDAMKGLGIDTSIRGVSNILDGEKLGRHAKDVQRMRALNLNRGDLSRTETLPVAATRYIEPRSADEVQLLKQSATNHVQNLEAAASRLESSGDPQRERAADALRIAAAEWKKKAQQKELDKGDFDAAYDSMAPQMGLVPKVLTGRVEESDIEDFLNDYNNS